MGSLVASVTLLLLQHPMHTLLDPFLVFGHVRGALLAVHERREVVQCVNVSVQISQVVGDARARWVRLLQVRLVQMQNACGKSQFQWSIHRFSSTTQKWQPHNESPFHWSGGRKQVCRVLGTFHCLVHTLIVTVCP